MKDKNKAISLIGAVEPQEKKRVLEAGRARRMHAYNRAVKRLIHGT